MKSHELNKYSYEYYVLNNPTVTDREYDLKYDELSKLEKETGVVLSIQINPKGW